MCKYHIVFTPKYRRKIIYNQYKADIRDIIKQLCSYKGVEIIEGHLMPFYNLYSFVCTQLFQNISNALFVLIINYFSSILWSEDDMVLTHPLCVC